MELIFCTSPLQVLIAREIKNTTNKEFLGVYLKTSEDKRQKIYADKMKDFCEEVVYIDDANVLFTDDFKNHIRKFKIDSLYVASLDNPIAYLFYNKNTMNLFTFDDGSNSIIKDNMYVRRLNKQYKVSNDLYIDDIFVLSQKHYTIFEGCLLFSKEKQIKITLDLQPKDFKRAKNNKTLKVFLGQYLGYILVETDKELTNKLTLRALKKYNIDKFYPHPRKKTIENNTNTDLIFEEEIYNILQEYEFVEVYSFYSTSLITLKGVEGVKTITIKTLYNIEERDRLKELGIEQEVLSISDTKVDIVMPVYNAETTIKESIESVLNQTHQNFRLIIVNDGSIDNTKEVISEYTDDKRILYVERPHLGIVKTLREGVDRCNSKYVARQDADDIWLPFHLDVVLYEIEKNDKLDIVASKVFDNMNKIRKYRTSETSHDYKGEDLWKRLAYSNVFNHSTVIFKLEAYKKVGGYEIGYDGFEDWHLWARMLTKENGLVINIGTCFYRVSGREERGLIFRKRLAKSRGLTLEEVLQ